MRHVLPQFRRRIVSGVVALVGSSLAALALGIPAHATGPDPTMKSSGSAGSCIEGSSNAKWSHTLAPREDGRYDFTIWFEADKPLCAPQPFTFATWWAPDNLWPQTLLGSESEAVLKPGKDNALTLTAVSSENCHFQVDAYAVPASEVPQTLMKGGQGKDAAGKPMPEPPIVGHNFKSNGPPGWAYSHAGGGNGNTVACMKPPVVKVEVGAECVDDAGTAGVTVTKLEAEPALTYDLSVDGQPLKDGPFRLIGSKPGTHALTGLAAGPHNVSVAPASAGKGEGFVPVGAVFTVAECTEEATQTSPTPPPTTGPIAPVVAVQPPPTSNPSPAPSNAPASAWASDSGLAYTGSSMWTAAVAVVLVAGGAVLVIFARRRKAMAS